MQLLQLALDILDLDKAVDIVKDTIDHIDYIEAGTPLIKNNGQTAITRLKRTCPDKNLIADMKTIDTGELDCRIAFNGGADGIIVQAIAPLETVYRVAEASKRQNKILMIDALGMKDMEALNRLSALIEPDHTILHIGIDEQPTHDISMLFDMANVARKHGNLSSIALAGGISSCLLDSISSIPDNVKVIISGAAITGAENPVKEAAALKSKITALAA